MKKKIALWILVSLLVICSCNKSGNFRETSPEATFSQPVDDIALNEKTDADANIPVERKIIREGDIRFETNNAEETKDLISKAVSDFKGYISSDNVYTYKDKVEHRIVIRVPAGNFDSLLNKISASARKIESKNINVLDVTEEFVDIEARIRTKKDLENRYKELLKKATKVEELLAIEKEIGTLRADIESIEGRLKYLSDRVFYSTLTVTFYEKTAVPFAFFSKIGSALRNGWTNLLWSIVGLTHIWPLLIIILTIAYIIIRVKRNKNGKTLKQDD